MEPDLLYVAHFSWSHFCRSVDMYETMVHMTEKWWLHHRCFFSSQFLSLFHATVSADVHGRGTKHSLSKKTNRIISNLVTLNLSLFSMILSNEVHNTTYCSVEELFMKRVFKKIDDFFRLFIYHSWYSLDIIFKYIISD